MAGQVYLPHIRPASFFAGRYFPPVRRYNMLSFKEVFSSIAKAWREDAQEVDRVGNQVLEHIRLAIHMPENRNEITSDALEGGYKKPVESYDCGYGGWGPAPKIPQPLIIEFLLRRATKDTTQRERIINAVTHALIAMSRGGMDDVVGGGFSRYRVDNFWRTPLFE